MYLCMWVGARTCVYVCACARVCVCMYVHTMYIYVYMYVCTCVREFAHVSLWVVHLCVCVLACVCACVFLRVSAHFCVHRAYGLCCSAHIQMIRGDSMSNASFCFEYLKWFVKSTWCGEQQTSRGLISELCLAISTMDLQLSHVSDLLYIHRPFLSPDGRRFHN